jgi:hypothetical protein
MLSWNKWYDGLPREWRFQFVLWPIIVVGAINMLLTFTTRFPFGLLLLFGIVVVALIRVPYIVANLPRAEGAPAVEPETPRYQIEGWDWVIDLNKQYDAMPEWRRFWVFPAVLAIVGAINMLLTIGKGFPFGLLFLIAMLAMVLVRAPYAAGWLKPSAVPVESEPVTTASPEIEHAPTAAIATDMPVEAPVTPLDPPPANDQMSRA